MLHNLILVLLFSFSISTSFFAQNNSKATGEWILDQIAEQGKYQSVGQIVDFNEDGTMYIQKFPFGTWKANPKENTITIDAEDIGGNYELVYISDTNMQLSLNEKDLYFFKIDREKILKDNLASNLIGLWEYANDMGDDKRRLIEFKAPDTVILVEKDEYMERRSTGIWLFDAELDRLVIIGQIERIRGINNEIDITDNEINFVNNAVPSTLKKVVQDAKDIERLSFSDNDFYDETGDYKYYDDEQKLPWQDSSEMIKTLVNVKQLVYKYSTLIEGVNVFESKILTADINANYPDRELSIDYIFNGYDIYNLPDNMELPTEAYNQYSSPLYPLTEHIFRIVGAEELTTPAGTFNCTVIEATGSLDENMKLWLINDQAGIFAKIIKEKPDENFGYYHVYELKSIETK